MPITPTSIKVRAADLQDAFNHDFKGTTATATGTPVGSITTTAAATAAAASATGAATTARPGIVGC
jgi:hypothetical protein